MALFNVWQKLWDIRYLLTTVIILEDGAIIILCNMEEKLVEIFATHESV